MSDSELMTQALKRRNANRRRGSWARGFDIALLVVLVLLGVWLGSVLSS
jgi:hypothetical protein